MTNWYPPAIAAIARKAGFTEPHVVTATAVAWAATHGADHHDDQSSTIPEVMTRGLWGIQRSLVTDDEWNVMLDPTKCARIAHRLWTDRDGNFDWHPVTWSLEWQNALALCTAALSGRQSWSQGSVGPNFHAGLRKMAAHATAMNDVRKRG